MKIEMGDVDVMGAFSAVEGPEVLIGRFKSQAQRLAAKLAQVIPLSNACVRVQAA